MSFDKVFDLSQLECILVCIIYQVRFDGDIGINRVCEAMMRSFCSYVCLRRSTSRFINKELETVPFAVLLVSQIYDFLENLTSRYAHGFVHFSSVLAHVSQILGCLFGDRP